MSTGSASAGQPPNPPSQNPDLDVAPEGVYHDAALQYLNVQLGIDSEFNSRNLQILGTGSTILPLTFALLSIADKTPSENTRRFLEAAVVAYLVLIAFALVASYFRTAQYKPNLLTLEGYTSQYSGRALRFWVAREYRTSTAENDKALRWKGLMVGLAWVALCVEGVLISLAALFALL